MTAALDYLQAAVLLIREHLWEEAMMKGSGKGKNKWKPGKPGGSGGDGDENGGGTVAKLDLDELVKVIDVQSRCIEALAMAVGAKADANGDDEDEDEEDGDEDEDKDDEDEEEDKDK